MPIFDLTSPEPPATNKEGMVAARGASRPDVAQVTALVERARHGDAAAIQELFRAHLPGVHRVVHRLVGPIPDLSLIHI